MFELKPDFEDVMERFEAWWDCELVDRPLVSMVFPRPEADRVPMPVEKSHATLRDRWMDAEYQVELAEAAQNYAVQELEEGGVS